MLCINSIKVCRENCVYSLNGIKFSNKMACVNGKILCINGIQFNSKVCINLIKINIKILLVLFKRFKDQQQNLCAVYIRYKAQ